MAEQSHLEKLLFARDGRRREPIDAIINEVLSTNKFRGRVALSGADFLPKHFGGWTEFL
jgi:hypothetical protein